MTSKKRTNDVIASEILKICVNGASKTRIVYQANLNFLTAKPYLVFSFQNNIAIF